MERTLILVKPDGVQRGLVGKIIERFETRGLKLAGLKFIQMSEELAARHYAVHQGKPFYDSLVSYIVSGPIVAMAWEGKNAIAIARASMGSTNPAEALPGTIRGDFGAEIGRNLVHGSDGQETANYELGLFFDASELVSWKRDIEPWIRE
ncbi:MAG TPA: nucleoside-diphosphate kinase [candidate division Zixibacteria bacterium]|nr:nucleoside-diphosphate kinase [candidate division Zixibacteria bacterium]